MIPEEKARAAMVGSLVSIGGGVMLFASFLCLHRHSHPDRSTLRIH
jgi:hypothetical protein